MRRRRPSTIPVPAGPPEPASIRPGGSRRRPPRTSDRDERDTPTRILDAAELLFANHGFKATTTAQIARASGRNAALIHYYFHDKQRLYQAVLHRLVDRFVGELARSLPQDADPEAAIRQVVRAQLAVLRARPHMLYLMMREMADWGARHAEGAIHLVGVRVFDRLSALIAAAQASGRFRSGVDPRFATISLMAQMNWFLLARPVIGVFLGRGLGQLNPEDLDAFADHAAEFVLAALRAPGNPESPVPPHPSPSRA